jgi:hypothetical protein
MPYKCVARGIWYSDGSRAVCPHTQNLIPPQHELKILGRSSLRNQLEEIERSYKLMRRAKEALHALA